MFTELTRTCRDRGDTVSKMKSTSRLFQFVASLTLLLASVASTSPAGASGLAKPTPGTAASIAAALKKAVTTTVLPAGSSPALSVLPYDGYTALFPGTCSSPSGLYICTWGPASPKKTIVLFGDSHAMMWVSAIEPAVVAAGDRLELLAYASCPVAALSSDSSACTTWRTAAIAAVNQLKPAAVIVAERSSHLFTSSNQLVSTADFQAGLTSTFTALTASGAALVALGDNPVYPLTGSGGGGPGVCLGSHPTHITLCGTTTNPTDPQWRNHAADEATAAVAAHGTFVNTTAWICLKTTCPPVVNKLIVYTDWSHLTATYAYYLSGVMKTAIRAIL